MNSVVWMKRSIAAMAFAAIPATAAGQGVLDNLGNALGDIGSGLSSLFRPKSTLESPPEKLPETVLSHPAFEAPPPLVRSIERRSRAVLNWPTGLVDLERLAAQGASSRAVHSIFSASAPIATSKDSEVTDYEQQLLVLGGLHAIFNQRREASSHNEAMKFTWTRSEVREVREVSGSLFPLEPGRRLVFTEVVKDGNDKESSRTIELIVDRDLRAGRMYPRLSGRIFLVSKRIDGTPECRYYWSEQLQFRLGRLCPGDSGAPPVLRAFEPTPEGVRLVERLRQEDEQAHIEAQRRQEEAARLERERLLAEEERRKAEAERLKAEEARRYAADVEAKRKHSASLPEMEVQRATRMFDQAMEFFRQGEFEAAALRFRDGLQIDPGNGLAHYYLAETLVRQQKHEEARPHYRWTADFAPDEKEAVLARIKLRR